MCQHYWLIDRPNGPIAQGRCKLCGEDREFSNRLEDRRYEEHEADRGIAVEVPMVFEMNSRYVRTVARNLGLVRRK